MLPVLLGYPLHPQHAGVGQHHIQRFKLFTLLVFKVKCALFTQTQRRNTRLGPQFWLVIRMQPHRVSAITIEVQQHAVE